MTIDRLAHSLLRTRRQIQKDAIGQGLQAGGGIDFDSDGATLFIRLGPGMAVVDGDLTIQLDGDSLALSQLGLRHRGFHPLSNNPDPAINGEAWYHDVQHSRRERVAGHNLRQFGLLYSTVSPSAALSAQTETAFSNTSLMFDPTVAVSGRILRVAAVGRLSTANPAGDLTLRLRFGGGLVMRIVMDSLGNALTNEPWRFEAMVRAIAGELSGFLVQGSVGDTLLRQSAELTGTPIGTLFALTGQWSNAGNSAIVDFFSIEMS
jgi:hypothetical protein